MNCAAPCVMSAVLLMTVSHAAAGAEHVCRYCRTGAAAAAPEGTSRKYAPDRQVDMLHIKLDVTPDFAKHTVAGTATLRFAPISKPLTSLRLDAIDLDVKAIRSSQAIRDFSTDDDSLTIVFEQPIAVGAEASVAIDYSAQPLQGLYFRTADMGLPAGDEHCWTQGEAHEARHWFPSFDYPNERASSEIICHVPAEMTVVSNGRLVGETDEGDGRKAVHWLQEKPHVSYLICMVAGHLKKLEDRHGDVPLAFYTQPSKAKYAQNAFDETADIMEFYEQEIGVKYPWDKYDQATCADYHWGGMENTTITTLTQRTIFADETENVRSSRSLNAHEMAHQWFGDYVTCKDWSQLWLNEGFATYYALLYEGHKFGRDALLYGLYLDARDEIFLPGNLNDRRPIVYREYQQPKEQFDFRNYPKASWVLHMLRSQLGEAVYRQAIQKYLQRHALSEVTTENLREALEEISGRPLDKFFDQWIYHGGFPELKVEYRWLPEEKKAHVTVEQTQTVDVKTLLFELPTTLRFIVDGKAHDEQVTIDGRRHDFYVSLPAEPTIVRFDPEYTVLGRIKFELPEKMLLAQLDRDGDALGRVLACDELAKRKTQAAVAGLRKALNSDKFYGVRSTAAAALRKIRTDEAVAALCESTDQEDARVRRQVIDELGKCYREEARQALLRTIEEEKNPAVVAAAVRGLGRYQGDDSRDAMRKALASDTFTDDVPAAAFGAIRDLNDGALAEELMKTIKSRDAELDPRDLTEGMITVAKISQRGRRRDAAFHFLVEYLGHPRQFLRGAAIQALGDLHEPDARELLEPIAASEHNETLAQLASAALAKLDKETPLASAEVGELRSDVRELRKAQDKLQKALDELKAKAKSSSKDNETSAQDDDQQKPSGDSDDEADDGDKPEGSDQ